MTEVRYNQNGNGNHAVLERRPGDRSEMGMGLEEWMEIQTKGTYNSSTGETTERYDSDILDFGDLIDDKVNFRKTAILIKLMGYYYQTPPKRVGMTIQSLTRISRVGWNQTEKLISEMLNDTIQCKLCSREDRILEIDELYKKGVQSSSYKLHIIEHLKHIRKEHFEKMGEEEFNSFVEQYKKSKRKVPTEKQKRNLSGYSEW